MRSPSARASLRPHRVPHAADRVDQLGQITGVDLAAQVADVHGEVLRVGSEVVVPDPLVDGGVATGFVAMLLTGLVPA